MSTQADIPSDLTDEDKAYALQYIDAELNSMILFALLYGMYTGILAVTLWNIFLNKCSPIRCVLVVVIILLHTLITISFAGSWSFVHSAFVENRKSFWTVYLRIVGPAQSDFFMGGIAAIMSTILTDLYMIWCCWMVWGQCWPVVLLPILSLIATTVSKVIEIRRSFLNTQALFPALYISFALATTLWCTILIIYHILTVAGVKCGAGSRSLYSISLIVYLALFTYHGGDFGLFYLDVIAGIAKGVAPTLLIGRAAAGHTRPNDDDYDGSTVSSLHFQAPSEVGTTSFQESTTESAVLEIDIEAQQEQSDELVVIVERA